MNTSKLSEWQGWGLTILRVVIGIVFVMHGAQKLFMMGIGGTAGFFGSLGIPLPVVAATLITALELLGGIALILGLFTRPVALLLAADMLVAMFLVHVPNGFFASDGGIELPLTVLSAGLALALSGPGEAALDTMLARRAPRATQLRT